MPEINKDNEQLKLISIFHYIVGGVTALFSLIPIAHVIIGIIFIVSPETMTNKSGEAPPAWFGWIFAGMGTAAILFGLTMAICLICSGRFIAKRKRYMFCLVVAGFSCLFFPFGTALGVFTIIVLTRPSVKEIFGVKLS